MIMIALNLKKQLPLFLFVTVAALFIGIFFTAVDFATAPFSGVKDFIELFSQWLVWLLVIWLFIYLSAIFKYIFALFFPVLVFFSSILAYFRYTMHATFTSMMLDAALDNDTQITAELVSVKLILFVACCFLAALAFVIYRFKKITVHYALLHLVLSVFLAGITVNMPRVRRSLPARIPFNLYFVTTRYYAEKKEIQQDRPPLYENTVCTEEEDLVVLFILGEALRSDHLGLNGYDRNTTPYLNQEDIISFQHIYSEYTHTNASVPHIMTRADSITPERAYTERSFVDLFKHCGFYTAWLANQESAKPYVYFMHECDTLMHVNINKSSYVFDKWTDGDLLPLVDTCLQKNNRQKMLILHTIGSHWYYNSHYPDDFQVFNPIVKSKIISASSKEEMINSYDNTILYTDFFIYSIIERLRDKNAVLIYLSDHGESFGENGVWLHAIDSPPVHRPACFVWMSPAYKTAHPDKYQVLQENKWKTYRTDFLFHTIALAAGITGGVVDEQMSLFAKE
jgi:glucan phosphoethanolaminetransferase (alkaline phosphatase superfamily)